MSEQLITEKLNELNSLPGEESGNLYIPVAIAIQEASDLYHWCTIDKEELLKGRLDWTLVEDLHTRSGALQQSQSQWQSKYQNYQECQKEWKIAAPLAYKLRDELLHYLRHAVRDIPIELAKVKRISEGSSHADMIQDLIDLSELGLKHTNVLKVIGMDLSLLDTARAKSFELSELLAKVNGSYKETSPMLEVRNKAYTHLKEAVDEIRRVGQYVFWRDDERFEGYVSLHLRKMNRSQKKKADQQEV